LLQPINNARTLSEPGFQNLNARFQDLDLWTWVSGPQREVSRPGSQDLGFRPSTRGFRTWISRPGFQALNARFQDLDLKTWVSGPQREVSEPESQDLGFRPSVFGSQDLGFRTSKALHPTVVLSFSRHFSLRPVVTDGRTDVLNLYIRYKISSLPSLSLDDMLEAIDGG
jgi:hypothetical protein